MIEKSLQPSWWRLTTDGIEKDAGVTETVWSFQTLHQFVQKVTVMRFTDSQQYIKKTTTEISKIRLLIYIIQICYIATYLENNGIMKLITKITNEVLPIRDIKVLKEASDEPRLPYSGKGLLEQ